MCLPFAARAYVAYDGGNDYWYGYADTLHLDDADAPDYGAYRPLSSAATSIETSGGDGLVGPIALGFEFDFYGELYDEIYLAPGGALVFTPAHFRRNLPEEVPDGASPNGYVAAGWSAFARWDTNMRYALHGAAGERQFVVEWSHRVSLGRSTVVTQVVLHERFGDIQVFVESSEGWDRRLVVGLESPTGHRGLVAYDALPQEQPLAQYSAIFSPYLTQPRLVVTESDLVVAEGGTLEVTVEARDRQDDVAALRWDVDGDGDFSDAQGTTVTLSAVGRDGPETMTVHVAAEDEAGNRREQPLLITVENVPPQILNEPELTLLPGREWAFVPEFVDPGGDEVTVRAIEWPTGMVVRADGSLRWTPRTTDEGQHKVVMSFTDDDDDPDVQGDGDRRLEFALTVTNHGPPSRPVIIEPAQRSTVETLRPTFLVETPTDPDGDTLFLTFEVDVVNTFDSNELVSSGPMPISLGRTGWTSPEELTNGEHYWWRVWAHDEFHEGPAARGTFTVEIPGLDQEEADDGDKTGDENEPMVGLKGCSMQPGQPQGTPSLLLTVCLMSGLLWWRQRR
jgi:hypothetical protein